MKKTIVFYNSHQYGDLLHNRALVKWIVNHLPNTYKCYFLMNKNPKSIFFHERVENIGLSGNFHGYPMETIMSHCVNDERLVGALWVNTWICSFPGTLHYKFPDGSIRYLLPTKNGIHDFNDSEQIQETIENQKKLAHIKIDEINEFLALNLSFDKIPYPSKLDLVFHLEDNGLTNYQKYILDIFIEKHNKFEKTIMICNGNTTSGQRENFVFEDSLKSLILHNKNYCFYFTDSTNRFESDNVFYVDDYFETPNLHKIEYIMAHCDVIVSSQSGPGCAAFCDKIIDDENKTLIILCSKLIPVFNTNTACNLISSDEISEENVFDLVSKSLERPL
jgi:hypothetical protein